LYTTQLLKHIFIVVTFIFSTSLNAKENRSAKLDSILSKAYDFANNYELDSLIYYSNELLIHTKKEDSSDSKYYIAQSYKLLGSSYYLLNSNDKAILYFKQALEHINSDSDPKLSYTLYNNLGSIYGTLYNSEESIKYFKKALEICTSENNIIDITVANYNIATLFLTLNQPTQALPYIENTSKFAELTTDSNHIANGYFAYAEYYKLTFNKKANVFYENAIQLQPKSNARILGEIHKSYANHLINQKDYKSSNFHLRKYIQLNDNIFNHTKVNQIHKIEQEYKVREIENLLEQQQFETNIAQRKANTNAIWLLSVLILTLIILILLLFVYKHYRNQKQLSRLLGKKNFELEKSRNSAEELAQVKTKFTETVTHELRTPLHGIIGLTSILIEDEQKRLSNNGQKHLMSLKTSADYLLNLINDVLDVTKIENKSISLEERSFNIHFLISNLKNSFKYILDQKNIPLITNIDPNIPQQLVGDPIRLTQVIINLIGNALKFTHKGEVVIQLDCISKNEKEVTIHFEINDSGIGIPNEKQKYIFDKFAQIKETNTDKRGTGLGLSIVKEILKLYDSEIHLESKLDVGSKFWFDICFTICKETSNNQLKNINHPTLEYNLLGQNILVIDDNHVNLIVTESLLTKNHFNVTTFDNGFSAIQAVESSHFDLILLDLHMPKMDGIETLKQIRFINENIPIILLTASNVQDQWLTLKQHGFDDYIIKPFDKYHFLQKIIKHVKPKR